MHAKLAVATIIAATLALPAVAAAADAPGTIGTIAGPGGLDNPADVVAAPGGGYYVSADNAVRKIDSDGSMHTVAGTGAPGYSGDGGPATSAELDNPAGLAVEPDGSLLIADSNNNRIRRVAPDGTISTFAGTGAAGFSGDGAQATAAQLAGPDDVTVAIDGSVLIADTDNQRIRRVTDDGDIATIAGSGAKGYAGDGGPTGAASFDQPRSVAATADGGYVIADTDNNRIRKVSRGQIATVAGMGTAAFGGDGGPATAAALQGPQRVDVASDGTLVIADTENNRVRLVGSDGKIATVAGSGVNGFSGDGGQAIAARLSAPRAAAALTGGHLLIADSGNDRLRRVEGGLTAPTTFVVNTTKDLDRAARRL